MKSKIKSIAELSIYRAFKNGEDIKTYLKENFNISYITFLKYWKKEYKVNLRSARKNYLRYGTYEKVA